MRAFFVAAVVTLATTARAQPTAQAEAMFREARALLDKGQIAKACDAFEASQKLAPAITTQLNIASCREKNGQLATAWSVFLEIERATRAATDDAGKQFHKTAADRAAKLEAKVSKLTITVEDPVDGLVVTRDGVGVDAALWGHALPIDGGRYEIAASAPGHDAWEKRVTIADASADKTVAIPVLHITGEREREQERPGFGLDDERPARATPSKLPALAAGIGAAALFGTAVGFELWGESIYADANAEFDRATQDALWDQANTRRYAAQGVAVAGIGLAALAIYMYLEAR